MLKKNKMKESVVDKFRSKAKQFGLFEEEYERILEILGRNCHIQSLNFFSDVERVIVHIKKLYSGSWRLFRVHGGRPFVSPEKKNAGLVDIATAMLLHLEIESHTILRQLSLIRSCNGNGMDL